MGLGAPQGKGKEWKKEVEGRLRRAGGGGGEGGGGGRGEEPCLARVMCQEYALLVCVVFVFLGLLGFYISFVGAF